MQKINIILLGSYPPPYHGSSIYLKGLSDLLTNDKEFKVYTVNSSDKKNDISNMGKIDFSNVYFSLKALFSLTFILILKKIDILYVPISQNKLAYLRDGIAVILGKVFRTKVIIHLHGSYFLEFYEKSSSFYKKFIDFTMKSSAGAIVLGNNLRYIFENWFSDNQIFVLPNFVEDHIKSMNSQNNIYHNGKLLKLTYLGNIVESKGILQVINAVEELLENGNDILLQIIGKFGKDPFTGMQEDKIKNIIIDIVNKYPERIKYSGQITDIKTKFYVLKNETDIFIFPSWYEGQPLVIIEAMQCGLPIISTKNCGAIEETVIEGYNGILVEKRNVNQLVNAIEVLIKDEQLRKRMGENSRKLYEENFTPEKHLLKFKAIVKNVLT
jgi:glycosyltransferase involved in cell wall biosynthesis